MSSITLRRIPADTASYNNLKARKDDTSKVEYELTGTFDRAAAELYALANTPLSDGHRTRQGVKLKEIVDHRDGRFRVSVNYVGPTLLADDNAPDIQENGISFSIGGQSELMTHSLETIASHINPAEAVGIPDMQNQINVVDGTPVGVEINPSSYADTSFTVEQKVRTNIITNAWLDSIDGMTRTVNTNTFRGRAPGTVLFWGMRGTLKLDEEFSDLSWEFFYKKNSTKTIGVFPNVTKKGWEYAWVYSLERKEESNGRKLIIKAPIALYVERLFDTATFDSSTIKVSP